MSVHATKLRDLTWGAALRWLPNPRTIPNNLHGGQKKRSWKQALSLATRFTVIAVVHDENMQHLLRDEFLCINPSDLYQEQSVTNGLSPHPVSAPIRICLHFRSKDSSSKFLRHFLIARRGFLQRHFVTHQLSHTTLSTTIFHTQLCQLPSFTHNFVTHHLSHTTLSHTIFHTQLCHTPSFTQNNLTHNFVPHNHFTHNFVVLRGRRGTFCVAGVAQSHIHLRFAWQAWHSWHWVARLGPI